MSATAAVESGRSRRPRTLTVRRPLVAPATDRRRLVQLMRRWLVRRTIVLGLLLVALCVVHVWLRLQVVNVGYLLSDARQLQMRLEQQRRELELELATRRDRVRLAELAAKRLGLREPDKGQLVELR